MKIALINPNSTVSMTEKIIAAARAVAPLDDIIGVTCHGGPAAIQGAEDAVACLPFLLAEIRRAEQQGAEAAVIACFDDPGLREAREAAAIPVLGIGQASFHAAMLRGYRFSVVTTQPSAIPVIEDNLARYGISTACARVRAAGIRVLDLEDPHGTAAEKVSAEIGRARAEDDIGAIVLGCAGMADLVGQFEAAHGLRVIDGVAAATALARALVVLR